MRKTVENGYVNTINNDKAMHMDNMLDFTCLFTGKVYAYVEPLCLSGKRLRKLE